MELKKSSIKWSLVACVFPMLVTGCSNVHEFINNPTLNALMPTATTAVKTIFYPERYNTMDPAKMVPTEFANTATDKIGDFEFIGFTSDGVPPKDGQYLANYYKPVVATSDKVMVESAFFSRYPQKTRSKKEFMSASISSEYNCSAKTFTIKSLKAFSGSKLDGVLVSDTKLPTKEQKPIEVSTQPIESKIYSKVCPKT